MNTQPPSISGFGEFGAIRYIERDVGIIVISNALGVDEFDATKLWNKWSMRQLKMAADKFGQHLFFQPRQGII